MKRNALTCIVAALLIAGAASAQTGGGWDLTWSTIDCGGAGSNNPSTGGGFTVLGTAGQPDAQASTGGGFTVTGGFWVGGAAAGCYADCDMSGALDFFDFLCFQNEFQNGTAYADCDGSGGLDFFDFLCFQNAFAAGCP